MYGNIWIWFDLIICTPDPKASFRSAPQGWFQSRFDRHVYKIMILQFLIASLDHIRNYTRRQSIRKGHKEQEVSKYCWTVARACEQDDHPALEQSTMISTASGFWCVGTRRKKWAGQKYALKVFLYKQCIAYHDVPGQPYQKVLNMSCHIYIYIYIYIYYVTLQHSLNP